jgi:hypothetical protein
LKIICRILFPYLALGLVCLVTVPEASATTVRFDFNAGRLLTPPSSYVANKASGNQKIVAQDINNRTTATTAATYTTSTSFNQYERWANGLSAGEGISSFNIFLRSDISPTASWGQNLRLSNWNDRTVFQASAGTGWDYKIVPMNQTTLGITPGPADFGYTIQWWTTDNARRINGKTDMTGFSFTAPLELFYADTGEVANVIDGQQYTVWFGTQNRPTDTLFQAPDNFIEPIKFDYVWGNSAMDTFAAQANTVWNGSMNLTAAVIPEPSTGSLLLAGAALAWLRRRRSA